MLRLVTVSPTDVDVLFELVTMHEVPDKQDLLAGLMQLHHHFKSSSDKTVKTVFTPKFFTQMCEILNFPLMPADADKHGIPQDHYLNLVTRLPGIRQNFANPDLMDEKFMGIDIKPPSKAYLN
jgi:hypothetical protein